VLTRPAARLVTLLVPRVRAAWPAIGAIALAVVLAHSGVMHVDAPAALAGHYRTAIGTDEWTRTIGIAQLFAAGGLCFRRTRVTTAVAIVLVLLAALANQVRTERADVALSTTLLMLVWTAAVAWGAARRAQPAAVL
jgi:hypothetical protein